MSQMVSNFQVILNSYQDLLNYHFHCVTEDPETSLG